MVPVILATAIALVFSIGILRSAFGYRHKIQNAIKSAKGALNGISSSVESLNAVSSDSEEELDRVFVDIYNVDGSLVAKGMFVPFDRGSFCRFVELIEGAEITGYHSVKVEMPLPMYVSMRD